MTEEMNYSKSHMPSGSGRPQSQSQYCERPDQGPIMADGDGNWIYPSAAATGHVTIDCPLPPGSPRQTETVLVRDFGYFASTKIESALAPTICHYKGTQANPAELFNWYVGVAKGLELLSTGAMDRMESLARQFATSGNPEHYFNDHVRPFLASLKPRRR
jgi:hypothetical protein